MKIDAYVDGSYREEKVGWASVIVKNGELYTELSGVVDEKEVMGTRQVAGELKAVEETLLWCRGEKIKEIYLHYDYAGIREWVTGAWKAKNPVTQKYRDYVRSVGIKINWVKVKSHSGVKYNDMADELARTIIQD
ncbi:MAG: RNase H family protein [Pseudomonadota bacterium]